MGAPFLHRQSAHCESGVTANLLRHHGVSISEAAAFGIGAGLFFGYFPFIRINGLPLITFRTSPGAIFKKVAQRLGVDIVQRTFRSPEKSMDALDRALDKGIPVGVQTGVFWLPYFPPALRFHFNAHNLVVYGREGTDYLISDPVLDAPVLCHRDDLIRARFAEGMLAPKGRMYYLKRTPKEPDLGGACISGLREVGCKMTKTPVPILGIRGIRTLAKRLERWPEKFGERRARQILGHVIRMQEEIGTGGGGFRFIFAAFLQEAAGLCDNPALEDLSRRMTDIGDRWRDFAVLAARRCKGRDDAEATYPRLAEILMDCARLEDGLYRDLLTRI